MEAKIDIYGVLHNNTVDGKLAKTAQIYDDELGKMQSEINKELYDGALSIQLLELPLDASYLGKICQYVGETTEQYTYGYFYKCVPSENTAELNHNATYYSYVQIDADLFAAAVGFVSGEYFVRADNDISTRTWKINNDSNATVASASSKEELEALGVLNCFGMTPYPGGFSVNLVSGGTGTWEQVNVQPSVGKKYNNGEIFNDYQNNKSGGYNSHIEGSYNESTTEGSLSHVEGSYNVANSSSSHVEGGHNIVNGLYAHVEGQQNKASGTASHVEGVGFEGLTPEDKTYYIGGMGFEGTAKITGDNNQIQCGHSLSKSYVGRIVKIYTGSLEFTVTLTEVVPSYTASGLLRWEERLDDSLVSEWNASVTACNIVPMVEGGTVDRAPSEAAHAEGLGTVTTNVAEHAEGKFNASHADTIHSIGIGNSDSDRKNAAEVKVNGNAYYYGIGGYDGTNPDTSKSLQEVIGDKANKVPIIDGESGAITKSIEPNKLYMFGECTSLNITLATGEVGIRNEYMFEFTSGATATSLTLPSEIKWILDIVIDPNYKYQVSIVNNTAIYGRVAL